MAERSLYLECASGISGDMFVGALLGLGADAGKLEAALNSMKVEGASIRISRVKRNDLDAVDFDVILDKDHDGHDHDMEYLYGHLHKTEHGDHHEDHHYHDEHEHHHEHGHTHEHGERHLSEVNAIIDTADITEGARVLAKRIFEILADAEGRVHGVPADQVHFHEVGAVDSIMDVVAAAVCFDDLGVKKVYVESLREGRGTVRSRHGILPIPVPAVSAILEDYALPMQFLNAEGEFITPTGAAIAAAITTDHQLPGKFTIAKIGIGSGKRKHELPSMLRAFLIEEIEEKQSDIIWKLEANMDDCTGEQLGYLMERLLSEGARDVHYSPCYMKKNRPATQLNVICDEEKLEDLENIIFLESTTIGIRRIPVYRSVLPREIITIKTPYGNGEVKVCSMPDGTKRVYPEYESVKKLALSSGKSYEEIYQIMKEYKGM
jgi:uncharacterized protein (TIGR00299 family) protein